MTYPEPPYLAFIPYGICRLQIGHYLGVCVSSVYFSYFFLIMTLHLLSLRKSC